MKWFNNDFLLKMKKLRVIFYCLKIRIIVRHIKLFESFDKYYEGMLREVFQSVIDDNLVEEWSKQEYAPANGLYYSIGHWENSGKLKECDIMFYCLKNGAMCPSPVLNKMDVTSEVERLKSMGYTTNCEKIYFDNGNNFQDVFYIKVKINI